VPTARWLAEPTDQSSAARMGAWTAAPKAVQSGPHSAGWKDARRAALMVCSTAELWGARWVVWTAGPRAGQMARAMADPWAGGTVAHSAAW
jgi:hypothetical protein